jgi:hypothetical protein
VGIVDWIVLIRPSSNLTEGLRIKKFPATEGGVEKVAVAFTSIYAPAADA